MKKPLSPVLQVISFFLPCIALTDLFCAVIHWDFPLATISPAIRDFLAPTLNSLFLIKNIITVCAGGLVILAALQWVHIAVKHFSEWLSLTSLIFHAAAIIGYNLIRRFLSPIQFTYSFKYSDNIYANLNFTPMSLVVIICVVIVIARAIPKPPYIAKASDQAPQ